MIETERQRQAAVSWIRYWKTSIAAGEQSWLGQEQAQENFMALHEQILAYDNRARSRDADSHGGSNQRVGQDAPVPQLAGTVATGGVPCGPGLS